jgi:hypothetical protein
MVTKLLNWIKEHYATGLIILVAVVASLLYSTYNSLKNPPDLENFKGSISNHLVWSIEGQCYFVRPYSSSTVYLIPVPDCNKGSK